MSPQARTGLIAFGLAGGGFLAVCAVVGVVVASRGGGPSSPLAGLAKPEQRGAFESAPAKANDWTYTDLADHLRKRFPVTVVAGEKGGSWFVLSDRPFDVQKMETFPRGGMNDWPGYVWVSRWESAERVRLELSRQGEPTDHFGWGRFYFHGEEGVIRKVRAALIP